MCENFRLHGLLPEPLQNAFNSIPTGRYKRGNYEGIFFLFKRFIAQRNSEIHRVTKLRNCMKE